MSKTIIDVAKTKIMGNQLLPVSRQKSSNRIKLLINLFNYNKPASCGYSRSCSPASCDYNRIFS